MPGAKGTILPPLTQPHCHKHIAGEGTLCIPRGLPQHWGGRASTQLGPDPSIQQQQQKLIHPAKLHPQHGWRAGPSMCCWGSLRPTPKPPRLALVLFCHSLNHNPVALSEAAISISKVPSFVQALLGQGKCYNMQKTARQHVSLLIKHTERAITVQWEEIWHFLMLLFCQVRAGENMAMHFCRPSLSLTLAQPPWTTLLTSWRSRARGYTAMRHRHFCEVFLYVFIAGLFSHYSESISGQNLMVQLSCPNSSLWRDKFPSPSSFPHSNSVHPRAPPEPSSPSPPSPP